ncbi:hypothetical protein ACSSS7_004368 [Eimeria intestinalis]
MGSQWRCCVPSLQPYLLEVRAPYHHVTAWRKLSDFHLYRNVTPWQSQVNHWTCYLQRRQHSSIRAKREGLDANKQACKRTRSLRGILHSVGLQPYAACERAWTYLGAVGALKLKEDPRTRQLYGPSRQRLIFVVNNAEVAQAWYRSKSLRTFSAVVHSFLEEAQLSIGGVVWFVWVRSEALEELHPKRHPLLLALDLEWASSPRAAHKPGGCEHNSRDADAFASKRDATKTHGKDCAGGVPHSFQLSLLQLCVEKQSHQDGWPPSCSFTKGFCSLREPATDSAFAGDPGKTRTMWLQRTNGITQADLATAIKAALEIGSICLFDLSEASEDIMKHLRRLLEHPSLPKIVHDCREDGAILFAHFGIELRGVFDTLVAAHVLQRSRGTEVFQQSLNDMLLENLGVV